jgi:aspartyl-tRNA(Asn)/glutamyl-tRNA(Gln) amidotransferase subunit C
LKKPAKGRERVCNEPEKRLDEAMSEEKNAVRLTEAEVDYIANLSRLHLSTAERERAATELSQILGYFEKLKELDTEGVEPTDHVLPVVNVLRPDKTRPCLTTEAALQNAPEQAADMFQVPRVVEAE